MIGGSSAIDGMIAMRGQAADRDGWHAQGLEGWGWSDMVGCLLGDGEHHGSGGGWRVEEVRVSWPFLAAVRDAPSEIGVPPVADFNTGANEEFGYLHPS